MPLPVWRGASAPSPSSRRAPKSYLCDTSEQTPSDTGESGESGESGEERGEGEITHKRTAPNGFERVPLKEEVVETGLGVIHRPIRVVHPVSRRHSVPPGSFPLIPPFLLASFPQYIVLLLRERGRQSASISRQKQQQSSNTAKHFHYGGVFVENATNHEA
jgi:hypothetical protein